jgi:hypothetical protein
VVGNVLGVSKWSEMFEASQTGRKCFEGFIVPHVFLQDSQDSILADVPANFFSPVGVHS